MSLTVAPPPVPTFSYGIITSASFDAPHILIDLFTGKFESVGHIYTNDATELVYRFACSNGFPTTTYPIHGGRSLPWSLANVIGASDAVYIIADEESKSAGMAAVLCERRAKRDEKFKWKIIPFDAAAHWREQVGRVDEIIQSITQDDMRANPTLAAIAKVLK
jgi:hypothetical protein